MIKGSQAGVCVVQFLPYTRKHGASATFRQVTWEGMEAGDGRVGRPVLVVEAAEQYQ